MAWQSDTKRDDGLYIHKLADDKWAIRYRGNTLTECPCCGKALVSARIARLVADSFFLGLTHTDTPPPDAA
jgi:hypothetical protein